MSEAHPSPLTLERAAVDDLAAAQLAEVRAHVDACASCRGFIERLSGARERRLLEHPTASFMARLAERERAAPRRAPRTWLYAVGALAAACAIFLVVPRGRGVRLRGTGPSIFRKRGPDVMLLEPGTARIRAGDALRVTVTVDHHTAISAWFVDAHGRVDALLAAPLELVPGQHELPGSAVVDAPCVDLQLVIGEAQRDDDEVRRAAAQERKDGSAIVLRCEGG